MTIRVLIVDDSIGMRTYMRTILSAVGFRCEEAVDGADAFQKMLGGQYDLVVTDLEMPHMDGYALLSKSGLTLNELEAAIQLLLERRVLRVKGETRGPRLVESWFQAVPCNWQNVPAL